MGRARRRRQDRPRRRESLERHPLARRGVLRSVAAREARPRSGRRPTRTPLASHRGGGGRGLRLRPGVLRRRRGAVFAMPAAWRDFGPPPARALRLRAPRFAVLPRLQMGAELRNVARGPEKRRGHNLPDELVGVCLVAQRIHHVQRSRGNGGWSLKRLLELKAHGLLRARLQTRHLRRFLFVLDLVRVHL
ncbi:hypothetical protein M885DRAFT_520217 [Pelagophyceae sp. CCMP2097]|nr:hypothetical protein M885DRAFT_520217 [Pelagophyceae sp. CCMP2097]